MPDRHLWTRHSTKTITFDGTSGNGLVNVPVTIFTLVGRVRTKWITAFCTEDLASADAATATLGTTGDVDGFIALTTATDIDANDWWTAAVPAVGSKSPLEVFTGGLVTSQGAKLLSENIILGILTGSITDGTIVFDVMYTPLTDGARLY